MPAAELFTPVTVQIDIPITRRLKLHAVTDARGVQVYHTKKLSDLFVWLLDQELGEFALLTADASFHLALNRAPSPDQS